MEHFDCVVAGGGMVGACAANLLAKGGMKILVVEPFDATAIKFAEHPCLRTSAFNRFSIDLLESLGAWQHVASARRAAYTGLQTWEHSEAKLSFDAQDVGAQYLGHILENNQVQQALWQLFEGNQVALKTAVTIQSTNALSDKVTVTLSDDTQVSANLLVGADGGMSKVRQMAGIGVDGWQYQQHCMAVTVKMAQTHPTVTWQEFHSSGPRAYLPLYDNYASLIWYDSAERIAQLQKLSDEKLQVEIEQAFPACLGEFEIIEKGSFPLTRQHAKRYFADRVVLIGDAAHTINPLAGQGVNLGFKDVAELAQCVLLGFENNEPFYDSKTLNKYHQARYKHNLLMMSAMDALYVGFSNEIKPIKALRNLGLNLANKITPVKNQVMKYAMGL